MPSEYLSESFPRRKKSFLCVCNVRQSESDLLLILRNINILISPSFLILSFFFVYEFKDKLKSENSKVLDNWPSLIEKLQSERDLARENSEYLSTLQEYFVVSIIDNNFSFPFFFPPRAELAQRAFSQ